MFIMQILTSLHFVANRNAGLAIPPLFWPVNWNKIRRHVAVLSDPTVNSLYCCSYTVLPGERKRSKGQYLNLFYSGTIYNYY